MRPIAVTLALLPAAALVVAAEESPSDAPAADLELVRHLAEHLAAEQTPIDRYLVTLGAGETRDDPTGFGGRRLEVVRRGAEVVARITIAVHDELVVATRVELHPRREDFGELRATYAEAAGERFQARGTALVGQAESQDGLNRWRASIERRLGAAPESDAPAEHRTQLETLSDPTRSYPVGATFGYAGLTPEGRAAADALRDAERFDLLRRALRSPNPEGRVEAARALLLAARGDLELTKADERAIRGIRRSTLPIRACHGCTVFDDTAAAILERLEQEVDDRRDLHDGR